MCVRVYVGVRARKYVSAGVCARARVCVYVCMYACVYVCMCICVCNYLDLT